jgi:hypothetical protein
LLSWWSSLTIFSRINMTNWCGVAADVEEITAILKYCRLKQRSNAFDR